MQGKDLYRRFRKLIRDRQAKRISRDEWRERKHRIKRELAGAAAALLLLFVSPAQATELPTERPAKGIGTVAISAETGGLATLAGEERAVTPAAIIGVSAPIGFGKFSPVNASVRIGIGSFPGEDISIQEPATYQAARVDLGLGRPLGTIPVDGGLQIQTSAVGEWGFASALPTEGEDPQPRLSRHYGVGVEIREIVSGDFLRVLYGRDEAAGDFGWGQILVSGELTVPLTKEILKIVGEATVNAGPARVDIPQRDIFKLGVAMDVVRVLRLVSGR